jgi:hypothetical protein
MILVGSNQEGWRGTSTRSSSWFVGRGEGTEGTVDGIEVVKDVAVLIRVGGETGEVEWRAFDIQSPRIHVMTATDGSTLHYIHRHVRRVNEQLQPSPNQSQLQDLQHGSTLGNVRRYLDRKVLVWLVDGISG